MYKMRKFDTKDFAYYTSPSSVFRTFALSEKKRKFISNADPQSATTKPFNWLLLFCYLTKYRSAQD